MSILNNSNAIATGGGYFLDQSIRFRESASAYLRRTPSTASNRQTFTFSCWYKKSKNGIQHPLFYTQSGGEHAVRFRDDDDSLDWFYYSGGYVYRLRTSAVYRDPSSWYHIVAVLNTTNGTASERARLYVNGERITSFQTASYPALNAQYAINTTVAHDIGHFSTSYNDGYMTEVNFVDGQALTASDFGEYNDDTGAWQPKRYAGSHGTNGFYLDMSTSGSTVLDQSTNSNNWTATNMNLTTSTATTYDKMTDVPTPTDESTGNFCTMNPLTNWNGNSSISQANLYFTGSTNQRFVGTMSVSSGKWYYEFQIVAVSGAPQVGIARDFWGYGTAGPGSDADSWGVWTQNGTPVTSGASGATLGGFTTNDKLQVALDMDTGKVWFGKNNTWSGGGNPSAGTGATFSNVTGVITPAYQQYATNVFNFGQRPFAYTPPTGFKAWNSSNLTDSAVPNGSEYAKTILWTGNSVSDRALTVGFKPNMVWLKARSNSGQSHHVADTVRGVGTNGIMKTWFPNLGDTEATDGNNSGYNTYYGAIQSIDANGFTVDKAGNNSFQQVNNSGWTYQAWNWKTTGNSPVNNTNGTITTTVSANPTSGTSIMTYTGNGSSGATIGHGLGAKPYFVIIKDRSAGGTSPTVYHENLNIGSNEQASLNQNSLSNWNTWNSTRTNTSTITLGNDQLVNKSGDTYVAYAFAPIEGFSKFGYYRGNGSGDGTFVHTGFRPAIVIWKRLDTAEVWAITDTAVNPYNVVNKRQYISYDFAELVANRLDILSNGFKFRDPDSDSNASGGTYIYMAWAENPFKNALAR